MEPKAFKQNLGQVYLTVVPILMIILGVGFGPMSYKIYLPAWIINACLMAVAAWFLGANAIRKQVVEKKHLVVIASFLIVPWLFIFIFFGFGVPPDQPEVWVATAAEQKVRYSILIFAGILVSFGFSMLREKLRMAGENLYSMLGFTAIIIAIPLFVINMTFWGFFLTESFSIQVATQSEQIPNWWLPTKYQFEYISIVEVALTYLATAAFAASLKSVGWFGKTASNIYIVISLLAFLLIGLSPLYPKSLSAAGYVVSIPAVPFMMSYFMGINLLRSAGK